VFLPPCFNLKFYLKNFAVTCQISPIKSFISRRSPFLLLFCFIASCTPWIIRSTPSIPERESSGKRVRNSFWDRVVHSRARALVEHDRRPRGQPGRQQKLRSALWHNWRPGAEWRGTPHKYSRREWWSSPFGWPEFLEFKLQNLSGFQILFVKIKNFQSLGIRSELASTQNLNYHNQIASKKGWVGSGTGRRRHPSA
jgi:hypothetical protein